MNLTKRHLNQFSHFGRAPQCNQPTGTQTTKRMTRAINQSINVKFIGRRYTTRPGAPTVVSGISTIIKYTLESFSECTSVSNVVEVGRKSVPGGWATVGESLVLQIQFLFLAARGRIYVSK